MKKVRYVKKNTVKFFGVTLALLVAIVLVIIFLPNMIKWQYKTFNNQQINPIVYNDKLQVLTNELASQDIGVTFLNYQNDNTVEASLSSGVKVVFSLDKDIISEVTSLQLILSRFRIEGRKVNNIDLRFKNAVVQ